VEDALQQLVRHGLLALFVIMLMDQLALPVPMDIFIFAAGGLVGAGKIGLVPAIATLLAAGVLGNIAWYMLGRRHGERILKFLCKVSVEPDSCVRRTQNLFTRHGVKALLVAKFVPGLNTVAAPLAGVSGVPFPRFLGFISLGLLLWIVPYLLLGMVFRHQLEAVAAWMGRMGSSLVWIVAGVVAAYFAYKVARRWHLLRFLRMSRVTAEEVKAMIDRGDPLAIIDLRHAMSVRSLPVAIPGSILMTPDEVESRHQEIARDRDVVLYCA
jgi:membrane protein DedA with SNARE-associated domain